MPVISMDLARTETAYYDVSENSLGFMSRTESGRSSDDCRVYMGTDMLALYQDCGFSRTGGQFFV